MKIFNNQSSEKQNLCFINIIYKSVVNPPKKKVYWVNDRPNVYLLQIYYTKRNKTKSKLKHKPNEKKNDGSCNLNNKFFI